MMSCSLQYTRKVFGRRYAYEQAEISSGDGDGFRGIHGGSGDLPLGGRLLLPLGWCSHAEGQTVLVERLCVTDQLRQRHLDGGARVRMRHEDWLWL
jgi:hypothetical protein